MIIEPLLQLIFPPRCAACDAGGQRLSQGLCAACVVTLVPTAGACCPRCSLSYLDEAAGGGAQVCGECLASPPPWERAVAAYAYGGALQDAIARWKNADAWWLSRPLRELFVGAVTHARLGVDCASGAPLVVPVPSVPRQLRVRGFNPAGVLAHHLSRTHGWPLEPRALVTRRTPPTTRDLSRAGRRRRLAGVFAPSKSRFPRSLKARQVVLVDDVMTTGATADAATRVLLRAGAARVWVATLARVPQVRPARPWPGAPA